MGNDRLGEFLRENVVQSAEKDKELDETFSLTEEELYSSLGKGEKRNNLVGSERQELDNSNEVKRDGFINTVRDIVGKYFKK